MKKRPYESKLGQKFGRLTVVSEAPRKGRGKSGCGRIYWHCICECGGEKDIRSDQWGKIFSCGCLQIEAVRNNIVHGESRTPLYRVRTRMLQSCENPNRPDYKNYGGKGVKVCEEWHDFVKFKEWAEANGYKKGLHLHRIDENGDYCPENCVWMDKNSHERLHGEKHAYKIQMLDDDGNVLETFNRQGEIFEKYGFDLGSVRRSIRTGYKTKGYYFRRIEK